MGNEAAKLAAPDDAERFSSALSGIAEVNNDPARCGTLPDVAAACAARS